MANNYLITGYWGEPHVTAENDRGINAGTFGAGRFVLPVGERLRAEYIGNNTIRLYDGKLMDNGAAAGIPVGEYVDLLIANTSQGMKRNDLIVFQYEQDSSTLVESGKFVVVQGKEASGTASDPTLAQADLLSGEAVLDQMPLWRVSVSGGTISAPVQLFSVTESLSSMVDKIYPVGSIYMSLNGTDPKLLFGGTWERIMDCFLLGAGGKYANGTTGGEETHTLTVNEMPSHTHKISFYGGTQYQENAAYAEQYAMTYAESNFYRDTSYTGGNWPHNNMPPYLAVYMWHRTA